MSGYKIEIFGLMLVYDIFLSKEICIGLGGGYVNVNIDDNDFNG